MSSCGMDATVRTKVPICSAPKFCGCAGTQLYESGLLERVNKLVDPASSHMLVSEIKPCMSKYRP